MADDFDVGEPLPEWRPEPGSQRDPARIDLLLQEQRHGTGDGAGERFAQQWYGSLIQLGDALYIAGDDGSHGGQLWKSDGTGKGTVLVKDFSPGGGSGESSSDPHSFVELRGSLLVVGRSLRDGPNRLRRDRFDGPGRRRRAR
jgi:ELWxxDGT repeat protein